MRLTQDRLLRIRADMTKARQGYMNLAAVFAEGEMQSLFELAFFGLQVANLATQTPNVLRGVDEMNVQLHRHAEQYACDAQESVG